MEQAWQRLLRIFGELIDIRQAIAQLSWDQRTYMPPRGGAARAEQLATLHRLAHERLARPEVGELLQALEEANPQDEVVAANLREARRAYDEVTRVPADLVSELARATALCSSAWEEAKRQNRFDEEYQAHLSRVIALTVEKAQALGRRGSVYETLLDLYEPGAGVEEVRRLFATLRDGLVPLVGAIVERSDPIDGDSVLRRPVPVERQKALCREVVAQLGFDFSAGRLDESEHPFTIGSGSDVRITSRYVEDDWSFGFFAALHEAGHALYEQGLDPAFWRMPVGEAVSLGIHESQSLLWENVVGRSHAFWVYALPRLQAHSGGFDDVTPDDLYRAVNRVRPSLIRVSADEVTYNLHVLLRFELEQQLVDGSLSVADLPDAWNEKMKAYLGIVPTTHAEGVLQDIHWSDGLIGYFPTYTLGAVASVQIYRQAVAEHPGLEEEIEAGRFNTLREWLRERIHRHGSMYRPAELLERVTGSRLDAGPFLAYLREKYGALYGLS